MISGRKPSHWGEYFFGTKWRIPQWFLCNHFCEHIFLRTAGSIVVRVTFVPILFIRVYFFHQIVEKHDVLYIDTNLIVFLKDSVFCSSEHHFFFASYTTTIRRFCVLFPGYHYFSLFVVDNFIHIFFLCINTIFSLLFVLRLSFLFLFTFFLNYFLVHFFVLLCVRWTYIYFRVSLFCFWYIFFSKKRAGHICTLMLTPFFFEKERNFFCVCSF